MHPVEERLLNLSRRQFFKRSGFCLGSMALGSLLAESMQAADAKERSGNPLAARNPQFPARAKHVIYLHMVGAPSQLDMFDHKPLLEQYDGKPCPEEFIKGKRFAFLRGHPSLGASHFNFQQHGQSGAEFSELLPHLKSVADDLTIIKTLNTNEFNHGPAQLFLHTGFGRLGRPSLGSWVSYGLLVVPGLAGLLALWRRRTGPAALWLLLASAVLACLIFLPQERFRIPVVDPALIIGAAVLATRRGAALARTPVS